MEETLIPVSTLDTLFDCHGHVTPVYMEDEDPRPYNKKSLARLVGGTPGLYDIDDNFYLVYDLSGVDGIIPINVFATFLMRLFGYSTIIHGNAFFVAKSHVVFK